MTSTNSTFSSFLVLLTIYGLIRGQNATPEAWQLLKFSNVSINMKSSSGCYRRFVGILIDQCLQECAARIHRCKSFNYKRFYKLCELCTANTVPLQEAVGVTHISLDTNFHEKAVDHVSGGVICSEVQKCVVNDENGLFECENSECALTEFLNERLYGKYINTGISTKLLLQTEPRCRDKHKTGCDIIECQKNGTWSKNLENKALRHTTWQSSTRSYGDASLAVDGDNNGDYTSGSCTHTNNELKPWWIVDLGEIHCINEIRIQNREDCCHDRLHNLTVFVGEEEGIIEEICATFPGTAERGVLQLKCCPSLRGRYVKLQIVSTSFSPLTLCEVEVY